MVYHHHLGDYQISLSDRHDMDNASLSAMYQITMPRQTHSTDLLICTQDAGYQSLDADALISDHVCIGIGASDCNMIAILGQRYYAVIHAGWRGLIAGIIAQTLDRMIALGEVASDVYIVIGPSIRSCCFEIGEEISGLRGDHLLNHEGHHYADMYGYMVDIFTSYHIPSDHIQDIGSCSKCHPGLRRSRRNGDTVNQALRVSRLG